MVKMFLNATTFFVGDGIELRRIWKKLLKKGYYTAFTAIPKFNPAGTYCIFFEENEIHWDNFNKYIKEGIKHYNKLMPSYQCFHYIDNGLENAKKIYQDKKSWIF